MDETTRAAIDRVTVKHDKPVTLPGGQTSQVFFDCVRLSPNDLARLAAEATGHLPSKAFDVALGVAYNGVYFASAVAGGRQVAILQKDGNIYGPDLRGKFVVVVSDVVCTRKELLAGAAAAEKLGAKIVGFACIVDRSDGKFGGEAQPLWSAYAVRDTLG